VVPDGGLVILEIAPAVLRGLATGETIVLPVAAGTAGPGESVILTAASRRVGPDLKPAYARWARRSLTGRWRARIEQVIPAAELDPGSFAARHIFAAHPEGEILVLRVADADGPVLGQDAFEARRRSVAQALR
jgi:hypothetical protein